MNVKQLITRLLEYESDADVYIQIGHFRNTGTAEGSELVRQINIDTSGRLLLECDYDLQIKSPLATDIYGDDRCVDSWAALKAENKALWGDIELMKRDMADMWDAKTAEKRIEEAYLTGFKAAVDILKKRGDSCNCFDALESIQSQLIGS